MPPDLPASRRDLATMSIIGSVHGISHFFHLLLPPLFPWLMPEFELSFSAIGGTMTIFFIVSGIGQAAAGFLVDRWGAARVLAAGICCFAIAAGMLSMATGLPMLFLVAALAGMGNSVFHPADFTVLNRCVSQPRLGHAFSIHGLSGNLGWALAPLFMTGLASHFGWRTAALGASLIAVLALVLLLLMRQMISTPPLAPHHQETAAAGTLDFLRSRPVWLCFLFFLFITAAFGAMQNFATPILQQLYQLSLPLAATALSAYLGGGALGIIGGGFLAQQHQHERIIASALLIAALLAALLASGTLPSHSIIPLMIGIGFCTGLAGPSRDLLVRKAATARFGQAAFGRIYGFVYSGLDLGLALSPLLFASLMDQQRFASVLVGVAILQSLAVLTALRVGHQVKP